MLLCNDGDAMKTDGKEFTVGMEIYCNEKSDYDGLFGKILEIRDGEDKETDNDTVDIVCELYPPEDAETAVKLEKRFSELYGKTMILKNISLDYTIMAPDMIDSAYNEPEDDNETGETISESGQPAEQKQNDATAEIISESEPDQKKKEHEESEAKRKAEWDKKQAEKKAADEKAESEINAMSDDAVTDASIKKLGDGAERITRRNMKICVTEHVQNLCDKNSDFARKVMRPKKSIINCFKYITRLALEYIKKEREDNGDPATGFDMGGDVPDDLCYQWAEDYFNDPDALEDKEKNDDFVPKPYYGGSSGSSKKNTGKKPDVKTQTGGKPREMTKLPNSTAIEQISFTEQMSLDDAG